MVDPATINANVAHCLQSANYVGYTRVHNICTGAVTDVPWGNGDWIMACGHGGVLAVAILMIASMAIMMLRDW